jgi:hypothetical protein
MVIKALRAQLTQALADGATEDIDVTVGEINLECQVAVTTSGAVQTGARFWVLSADATSTRDVGSVHRLAVTLTPGRRMPDGSTDARRQCGVLARGRHRGHPAGLTPHRD